MISINLEREIFLMTDRNKPLLYDIYPNLEKIPWVNLAPLKTPVKELKNLEDSVGFNNIWIKRDDLSSPIYGGNKVRKLEFLLADALEKDASEIMTTGGIGSNHCVATAAFSKKLGRQSISAVVDQPITEHVKKNLLLELYFGAKLIYAHSWNELRPKVYWYRFIHPDIYYIGPGGSNALGTIGFVNAAFEIKKQVDKGEIPEPDHLFVANGSMGTTAGLSIGIKLAGLKTKIHGIQVTDPRFSSKENTLKLAKRCLLFMRKYQKEIPKIKFDHVVITSKFYGETYGKPTEEGMEAIKLLKEDEGINLESTYTGKAFAGLLEFINKNKNETHGQTILFWNTHNSRDFSEIIKDIDYRELPQNLHWVFEDDDS